METTMVYWGYIDIVENKMEITIASRVKVQAGPRCTPDALSTKFRNIGVCEEVLV